MTFIGGAFDEFKESLTKDQIQAINNITYDINNVNIAGSFTFPKQKYWSDIDVQENFYIEGKGDKWNDNAEKILKELTHKIEKNKEYFISDIKCGYRIDFFLLVDIGTYSIAEKKVSNYYPDKIKQRLDYLYKDLHILNDKEYNKILSLVKDTLTEKEFNELSDLIVNVDLDKPDIQKAYPYYVGYLYNGNIKDYNYNLIKANIDELNSIGAIDKEEYKNLKRLFKKNPTIKQWEEFNEYIRSLTILRWTPKDIKKGEIGYGRKIGDKGPIALLNDVVSDRTIIKIDVIGYLDFKYIDMSNFMIYHEKIKNKWVISNLPETYEKDYEDNIKKEIEQFFYSPTFFKPAKGIKRMYSLARRYDDKKMLKILDGFIESDFSLLSQLSSQLETISILIDKNKQANIENIKKQIDNMKQSIFHTVDIEIDKEKILKLMNDILKTNDKNSIIKYIEEIREYIKDVLNRYVINELNKKYKIYKIPNNYLPDKDKRQYKSNSNFKLL